LHALGEEAEMQKLSPLFEDTSDERMLRFAVAEDFFLLGESMFLSETVLGLNAELGRGIALETRARVNWCPNLEGGPAYMLH
jgi:hypothetical protein